MSAENVDLVQRGYDALNQGDYQTLLAMFDPRVEIRVARQEDQLMNPDLDPSYQGLDGFMRFMGQLLEAWDTVSWEPEDVRDVGGDRVIALVRMTATGKGSGTPVEQKLAHVCTVRDGKLVELDTYWDREEALREVGLA